MARNRNREEVRQHDLRKYTALLIFAVVLIILFLINGIRNIEPAAEELQLELTPVPTYTVAGEVVQPVLISPSSGEQVSAGVVVLVGTGAPDAPVQIVAAGTVVGETTSDAGGNWQAEIELLKPGQNELVIQGAGSAPSILAELEPITLLVTVPVVEVEPPSLDLTILDGTIANGEIDLKGTGEPGSELQIMVDGALAETVTVDDTGQWSVQTALAEPGQYAISLSAVDASGSQVAAATAVAVDVIAQSEPADAVESDAVEPEAQPVDTAPVDDDAESATDTSLASATVDSTATEFAPGFVTLNGTGSAGSEVTVGVDEAEVGRAQVDGEGSWAFVTRLSEPGVYNVTVTDALGVVSAPVAITVLETAVAAAGEPEADVETKASTEANETEANKTEANEEDVGEITGDSPTIDSVAVASEPTAPQPFVEIAGTGAAGDELTILVDDVAVGRAPVTADSTWQFVTRLGQPGEYSLVASSENGVVSEAYSLVLPLPERQRLTDFEIPTDDVSTDIETEEPAANAESGVEPEVDSAVNTEPEPEPNDASSTTYTVDEALAEQAQPAGFVTLYGAAPPSEEVSVLVDDTSVGRSMANADGVWEFVTRLDQPGSYAVSVVGAEGSASDPVTVQVVDEVVVETVTAATESDETADSEEVTGDSAAEPDAEPSTSASEAGANPSIDPALTNRPISTGYATLYGEGTPNTDVQIAIDGINVGRAAVGSGGTWQFVTRRDQPGSFEVVVASADGVASLPAMIEVVEKVILATAVPQMAATAVAAPTVADRSVQIDSSAGDSALTIAPFAATLATGFVDFSGTGEPGSVVEVTGNDTILGRSTVGDDGVWSLTARLAEIGEYEIGARTVGDDDVLVAAAVAQLVAPGSVSASGSSESTTVATATDVMPQSTSTATDTAAVAGTPLPTSTETRVPIATATDVTPQPTSTSTDTPQPTSTSTETTVPTAEPTATEELVPIATATDVTPQPTSTSTDTPQPTSTSTETVTPTPEPTATPVALVIETFALEKGLDGNAVSVEGSGVADSLLTILINGAEVTSTTVDADSRWSAVVPIDESGEHEISVLALDDVGNAPAEAATVNVVVVPTPTSTSTGTPTNTPEPTATETLAPIATATDVTPQPTNTATDTPEPTSTSTDTPVPTETPTETPEPTDTPAPTDTAEPTSTATPIPPVIEIFALEKGLDGNVVSVEGSGVADSLLTILINGAEVTSTTVDADSRWSAVVPIDESGEHEISVLALDDAGDVLAEAAAVNVVVVPTPTSTSTETPTNTPEPTATETLAPIATATDVTPQPTNTSTDTPEPTSTSTDTPVPTEEPTETPEPTDTPAPTDTAEPTPTATDVPTNTPEPTSTETATIEPTSTVTETPTGTPTDTPEPTPTPVEPVIDPAALAQEFGDDTAEITGIGEVGSMVELLVNGRSVGTTEVDSLGTWSLDVELNEPGEYILDVRPATVDETRSGSLPAVILIPTPTALPTNTSTATPDPTNTPEATSTNTPEPTATPVPPAIDSESLAEELLPGLITLSGDGQPASLVDILVNGVVEASAEVDAEGIWETELTLNEPGIYALNVQADRGDGTIVTGASAVIARLVAPEPTETSTATSTATHTPEPTSTKTETPEPTATATETPEPTNTPKPTSTSTETPEPTEEPTRTPKPTATATDEPTETPVPTSTNTPEPTSTNTPEPTATRTPRPTATATNAPTETPEPTEAPVSTTPLQLIAPAAGVTDKATDLSGIGEPGATVEIVANNRVIDSVTIGDDGSWSYSADLSQPGVYALGARTVDADGTVLSVALPALLMVSDPEPTATNTALPTATATETPEPTATSTDTPVPTPTATETPEPTATATAAATETATPRPTATFTATPKPTATATRTPLPTATATNTPEPTATSTDTPIPTPTATETPEPTATATAAATETATPEPTATFTATPEPTATATDLPTATPEPTSTNTPEPTPTPTPTNTPVPEPLTIVVPANAAIGTVVLRGTGEPGDTVEVVANSHVVGTTAIGEDGRWRFGIKLSDPGIYAIGARIAGTDGSTDGSMAIPVFLLVSYPTATPKPTSTPSPTPTVEPTTASEPTAEPASVVAPPSGLPPTGVSSLALGLPSMAVASGVVLLLAGYVSLTSRRRRHKK